MAHFAELDENNYVIRVIVINNDDCLDQNGVESEDVGQQFCHNLFGGRWIQTSYNGSIRKQFAAIGDQYLEVEDVFVIPQPKPWYVLDDLYNWVVPIGIKPDTGEVLNQEEWTWLEKVFGVDHEALKRGYRNV